jgi:ribose-phosphate pyrophosphokinase
MKISELMAPGYPIKFSAGEIQIRLVESLPEKICLDYDIRSSDDLMTLLLVKDALDRAGVIEVSLSLEYLPYGRQDRACYPGEAFSLKVFCDLINAAKFYHVSLVDPHSEVSGLLERSSVIPQFIAALVAIPRPVLDKSILMAPDHGALEKTRTLAMSLNLPFTAATKIRDADNGDIVGIEVNNKELEAYKYRSILVVDDICDGGKTFIELAKAIRQTGSTVHLFLYVTHGIFSKGFFDLLLYYKDIFIFKMVNDTVFCNPNVKVYTK